MIDGWMGDDWFHYGAFRQPNIGYILGQTSARGKYGPDPNIGDDYTNFLEHGSAGAYAQSLGRRMTRCVDPPGPRSTRQ